MTGRRAVLAALTVAGLALLALWMTAPGSLTAVTALFDADRIERRVAQAGSWGPVLIIGLMTLAVVASPLPSAPIAMVAGAAYGQVWGTVQVVVGAELGALIAFGLARLLGHDAIRRVFGDRVDQGLMGSQSALMITVFVTRLMPFLSFDMISYAAGLTRLHLWRFAVATLAGIVPASFVLAHLGGTAVRGDA
ncbi:MAG: TVP38/TMEM64 family protein, partial [Rhodobacterales bacterium]|nr:TVP38/TMEM64 family protein [Rhodobacterales bacterium]MDX5412543.1 TVP38/TMEM64 family protein [Rhodobacterales bacterium]